MHTQVRFHGSPQDVPAAFREAPPATVEGAKLNCDRWAAQKTELDHRLAPLLDKIQAGTATPEEMALVTELAEDSRILADRLHRARVELTVAQQKQEQKDAETKRARFDQLVIETRQRRSEFARLYRSCCIVLGSLCANVDEATQIANSFINVAGMNPVDRNSVAEMSERIDPLPALLDSELSATVGFGWDFRISVVPLKGESK
jgi:hypothetical protein